MFPSDPAAAPGSPESEEENQAGVYRRVRGSALRRIIIPLKPLRELFRVPVVALGIVFFFVGIVEWLLDDQKYWLMLGLVLTFAGLMIHLSRSRKRRGDDS